MNKLIKQAFTLIELLVVIAIIGILSGLIVVSIGGMTTKANIAKTQVFSNSLRNSLMMNLVSEWKLDSNTNDSWGGKGGVISGTVTSMSSDCIQGSCYSFGGGNITINSFNIGTVTTISLWAKISNYEGGIPFSLDGDNYVSGPNLFFTSGTIAWNTGNGATNGFTSGYPNADWHNFVIINSVTNNNAKLYIDGILKGTAGYLNTTVTAGVVRLGCWHGGGYCISGLMDEVRVYNADMPTSQIKEQYYAGLNSLLANGNIGSKEYKEKTNLIAEK